MNHYYISENKLYPFNEDYLIEGVFVLWKLRNKTTKAASPTWHANMLWNNSDSREFLNNLTFDESVEHYFGVFEGTGKVDYVITDSTGKILMSNFDAEAHTDAYGVTKITAESKPEFRHFVMAAQSASKNGKVFYINGSKTIVTKVIFLLEQYHRLNAVFHLFLSKRLLHYQVN